MPQCEFDLAVFVLYCTAGNECSTENGAQHRVQANKTERRPEYNQMLGALAPEVRYSFVLGWRRSTIAIKYMHQREAFFQCLIDCFVSTPHYLYLVSLITFNTTSTAAGPFLRLAVYRRDCMGGENAVKMHSMRIQNNRFFV